MLLHWKAPPQEGSALEGKTTRQHWHVPRYGVNRRHSDKQTTGWPISAIKLLPKMEWLCLLPGWLSVVWFVICYEAKLPSIQVLMEMLRTKYQCQGFFLDLRVVLFAGRQGARCKGNGPL